MADEGKGEQKQTQQEEVDQDFEAAFNDASSGDTGKAPEGEAESTATGGEDAGGSDTGGEAGAAAASDTGGEGGTGEAGKSGGDEGSVEDDLNLNVDEADPEDLRQRTRSWQGRLRAENKRAAEEARKAQAARDLLLRNGIDPDTGEPLAGASTGGQPSAEHDTGASQNHGGARQDTDKALSGGDDQDLASRDGLDDEQRQALEDMKTDMPETYAAVSALVNQALAKSQDPRVSDLQQAIQPLLDQHEKDAERAAKEAEEYNRQHYAKLDEAFGDSWKDWRDSGALNDWVKTLPYQDAVNYQRVMESGTTEEVFDMFDAFQKHYDPDAAARRNSGSRNKPDNRQEDESPVRSTRPRPDVRKSGGPDKDDFEGAFNEAAASK